MCTCVQYMCTCGQYMRTVHVHYLTFSLDVNESWSKLRSRNIATNWMNVGLSSGFGSQQLLIIVHLGGEGSEWEWNTVCGEH